MKSKENTTDLCPLVNQSTVQTYFSENICIKSVIYLLTYLLISDVTSTMVQMFIFISLIVWNFVDFATIWSVIFNVFHLLILLILYCNWRAIIMLEGILFVCLFIYL